MTKQMEDKESKPLRYFLNQTVVIADYFENWLFPNQHNVNDWDNKRSAFCELYDAFSESYQRKNGNPGTVAHNCIGCNFEESALTINFFLQTNINCKNVQYYLSIYSLLFYIHAERLAVIYKEIGFVTKQGNFEWEAFPNLQSIKYWANFFKHPKAYMFLHHPDFFITTDPGKPNFMINEIIDHEFVRTYYKAGADNKLLREILANKKNVKVFFPDLVETTKLLCAEFSNIISIIINDPTKMKKLEAYTRIVNDYKD